MAITKLAAYDCKLYKANHTKTGFPIFIVAGNTLRVYKAVKANGFVWETRYPVTVSDGQKIDKYWWCYDNRLTPLRANSLAKLGIDMSEYDPTLGSVPVPQTPAENAEIPAETEVEETPKLVVDQSLEGASQGSGRSSRWAKFPIKGNIYQTDIEVDYQGEKVPLHVIVSRVQTTDKWDKLIQGRASYRMTIYYNGEVVGNHMLYWNDDEATYFKFWNPQKEIELLGRIPQYVQNVLDKRIASKTGNSLYKKLQSVKTLELRDPSLTQFLDEEWEDKFVFEISEGRYAGRYDAKVQHRKGHNSVSVYPDLQGYEINEYEDRIFYSREVPDEISNIEQFKSWMQNELTTNHGEMVRKMEDFLKRVSYLPEDKENIDRVMQTLIQRIMNKNYIDVDESLAKFKEMGYFRPRKTRRKIPEGAGANGLAPILDDSAYMLDSKVILEDFYRGKTSSDPKWIWTLMAYFVHYWKGGNAEGMFFSAIEDRVKDFVKQALRWGFAMDFDETYSFIRNSAGRIYAKFYHRVPPGTRGAQARAFYDWYHNSYESADSGRVGNGRTNDVGNPIDDLVDFASQYDIDEAAVRSDPRGIFRKLSRLLHPDMNIHKDEVEAKTNEEQFKVLNNINERIVESFKGTEAFASWKDKFFWHYGN